MPKQKSYTDEELIAAVKSSYSIMEVLRKLGIKPAGGSHTHMSKRIALLNLSKEHFCKVSTNKGKPALNRLSADNILVRMPLNSPRQKAYLLNRALNDTGVPYQCSGDGCDVSGRWLNKSIKLHVDHIDGDYLNNEIENLRFLCPNCHSQTDTYCKKK